MPKFLAPILPFHLHRRDQNHIISPSSGIKRNSFYLLISLITSFQTSRILLLSVAEIILLLFLNMDTKLTKHEWCSGELPFIFRTFSDPMNPMDFCIKL